MQQSCPRWLILVQGIADPGQWGENLSGARLHPVDLDDQSRLVYSPHLFGPSFFGGSNTLPAIYRSTDFPSNLPAEWDALWGYLAGEGISPVVLGEFGGSCQGRDEIWHRELIRYLKRRGVSGVFYSDLNPDNSRIGGLLQSDWLTPNQEKLDVLRDLPASPIELAARLTTTESLPHATSTKSVDERSPNKPFWGEQFCRTVDDARDLRRKDPPRFCYQWAVELESREMQLEP